METSRERLRAALLARCREERTEPPTPKQIERLTGAAEALFEREFTATTTRRLPVSVAAALEDLIAVPDPDPEGEGEAGTAGARSFLQELKEDPGPLHLETLLAEIVKLERVEAIGLPESLFEGVSEKVVEAWRARAMRMYPSDFAAAPAPIRLTLLAALCWVRKAEMIDGLVELLIQLVHKISVRAEKKVENEISSEFRRVQGKHGILARLAPAALDLPEELVRTAIYPVVGAGTLADIVAEALKLLDRYADSEAVFYDRAETVPIEHVVPEDYQEAVVDERGRIERIPYELCVLVTLRKAIRRREIWVEGGKIWRNPEADLPADFDDNRDVHYEALKKPRDPAAFIADLQRRHTAALDRLDKAMRKGSTGGVKITRKKGEPWISVPPLGKQEEPAGLKALKKEISRRWGVIDLLDVLKDVAHVTDYTTAFSSVASRTVTDPAVVQDGCCCACTGWGRTWGSSGWPTAWPRPRCRPGRSTTRRRCGAPAGCSSTATTCARRSASSSTPP